MAFPAILLPIALTLDETRVFAALAPWLIVFPGIAIVITVLSLNLFGGAAGDLVDPQAMAGRGLG